MSKANRIEKMNYSCEREKCKDNPNLIRVVESYEIPRYEGKIHGSCDYYCRDIVDSIKDACKIWVRNRDYSSLCNIWENDSELYDFLTGNLEEDLEIFQKKLDRKFGKGKYEAFVLGAYIHSGTSFSISKGGDRRCQWDSSQLGFIGIPVKEEDGYGYKSENADQIADELTDAWEGGFEEYEIYDNLDDEWLDCYTYGINSGNSKMLNEWKESMKEKYGVDFENVEVIY